MGPASLVVFRPWVGSEDARAAAVCLSHPPPNCRARSIIDSLQKGGIPLIGLAFRTERGGDFWRDAKRIA